MAGMTPAAAIVLCFACCIAFMAIAIAAAPGKIQWAYWISCGLAGLALLLTALGGRQLF